MYPAQRAGLRYLFVQCRNKFVDPTYTSLQTNSADAILIVNKNCEGKNYN